jgi:hypothetical protein
MSNILHTPENLQAALDMIAKGIIRPTQIAKGIGIAYRTYCSWMVRSTRGDEAFLVEYAGETMQWAKAIALSKRLAMLELRGMLEQYSIFGTEEVTTKDGQLVWALDPEAAAIDDPDIRELLGFRRDALLEIDGKLQPVKVKKLAPVGLQLRILEAAFKDMRPGIVQEVNVNGQMSVGIGFHPKATYQGPPPPLLAEPAIPQIEDQSDSDCTEGDFEEAPPQPAPVVFAPQINIAQPEPVVIREEPPVEYTPQSSMAFNAPSQRQPGSPLERDLMERVETARRRLHNDR